MIHVFSTASVHAPGKLPSDNVYKYTYVAQLVFILTLSCYCWWRKVYTLDDIILSTGNHEAQPFRYTKRMSDEEQGMTKQTLYTKSPTSTEERPIE